MDTSPARPGSAISVTTPETANISTPAFPTPPTPTAAPTPAPAASATGMQKLLDTMRSLGMNTGGLNISYSEEHVGYPGGSYMNRMINVTSNGRTEQFSADLTEKNPLITAFEIQRYLGVPSANGGTSGFFPRV